MKKLTVNEFFAYSTPWEDAEKNAQRCGNMIKSEGWSSIIDLTYSLVIEKAHNLSFNGFIWNTRTDEKICLKAHGISSIITACNLEMEKINSLK